MMQHFALSGEHANRAGDARVIANTLDLDDLKIRITPLQGSDNPSQS